MEKRKSGIARTAVVGIIFMLFGIFLLAENLGILTYPIGHIVFSWQMLLIGIGVIGFINKGWNPPSIILIAIGVFFLIPDMFNTSFEAWRLFWPFIFVVTGIAILFHSNKHPERWKQRMRADWQQRWGSDWHRRHHRRWRSDWCNENETEPDADQHFENTSADFVDEVNVFSGGDKKITSKTFRGGKMVSIFGGGTYDLMDCELSEGKNVLEMVNIFGGAKLIIPADWVIHLEVVAIFGGFSDRRRRITQSPDSPKKELYITGIALFGGGEIKSF